MTTSLLAPLEGDHLRFVQCIAAAFEAHGVWPIWQYVDATLGQAGVDATSILNTLPVWNHGYRPIWFQDGHTYGRADPAKRIGLTVQGMWASQNSATDPLLAAFLVVFAQARQLQIQMPPDPNIVQQLEVTRNGVRNNLAAAGVDVALLSDDRTLDMLQHETATWSGLQGQPTTWSWIVTSMPLVGVEHIISIEDYLLWVEAQQPQPTTASQTTDPADLIDAIDYLSAVWQVVTRKPLLQVRRLEPATRLLDPVASQQDFQSACSALSDIIDAIRANPKTKPPAGETWGRLIELGHHLAELLTEDLDAAARTWQAVETLRDVVAVRRGQQHSHAADRGVTAEARLGLMPSATPADRWNIVCAAVMESLRAIRDELGRLNDAE